MGEYVAASTIVKSPVRLRSDRAFCVAEIGTFLRCGPGASLRRSACYVSVVPPPAPWTALDLSNARPGWGGLGTSTFAACRGQPRAAIRGGLDATAA